MRQFKSIAMDDLASLSFEDAVVRPRLPVVITGFARAWPVVQAAVKSDEAMCDYLTGMASTRLHEVLVAPSAAQGLFFYRDKLEGLNFNRQTVQLKPFLDHLIHLRNAVDAPALFIQSTPVSELFSAFQSAHPNAVLPDDVEPRAWIGNRTRVATHFDVADNIAVVVAGKRRLTLFPPDQVRNLYVGPLDFTLAGQPVSLVDPQNPDFQAFPLFREALDAAVTVELEPGDALFIPSPWWHYVEALAPINMLVNYWWRDYPTDCGTPFNALIHGLLSLRHLPVTERAHWRALIEHYVFETNGDPAAHIPPSARSVLGPMTPDLAHHLKRWLRSQFDT